MHFMKKVEHYSKVYIVHQFRKYETDALWDGYWRNISQDGSNTFGINPSMIFLDVKVKPH